MFFSALLFLCILVHVFEKTREWKLQKFLHVSSDSFLGDSSATWEHLYMLNRPLLPRLWEELIEVHSYLLHGYLPCRSTHRGEWGEHFASGCYSCLLTTRDSETPESWIILGALKGNLRSWTKTFLSFFRKVVLGALFSTTYLILYLL